MTNALPTVKIGNKRYFVDHRLQELRNIKDPSDKESYELAEYWLKKVKGG